VLGADGATVSFVTVMLVVDELPLVFVVQVLIVTGRR
jgi:hypothetical protein